MVEASQRYAKGLLPLRSGGRWTRSLTHTIPLTRPKRLGKLCHSEGPATLAMTAYTTTCPTLQRHLQARSFHSQVINTTQTLESALADQLHRSIDGRGLIPSALVPNHQRRICDPPKTTTGRTFTEAVQVRDSLLHISLRALRDRPEAPTACDACGRPESSGHILQVCPRSHGARMKRRNKIEQLVVGNAKRKGWSCLVEPAIPTRTGLRRPDTVIHMVGKPAYVIDVQVVADKRQALRGTPP